MPTKLPLTKNPQHNPPGIKSYTHLLRKYHIHPTKLGPYFIGPTLLQAGRAYTNKPIGGKAAVVQVLQKRVGRSESGDEQGVERVGLDDVPEDISVSRSASASVDMEGEREGEDGFVEVAIGSPAQRVWVGVDTGLCGFWVWSTAQHHHQETGRYYDASKSSASKPPTSAWRMSYADQSFASGTVGADKVELGGLVVRDQPLQLADTVSPGFVQGRGEDGILGLGLGGGSNVTTSLVESMKEGGHGQVFTAKLGRSSGSKSEGEGPFYTFGFVDEGTVQRAIGEGEGEDGVYYTPVDGSGGYWKIDSPSVTINGKRTSRTGNKAIVDTGTPLVLIDDRVCQDIYDAIPGAVYDYDNQGYIIPSSSGTVSKTGNDNLPTVSLAVGEKEFVVRKEDLRVAGVDGRPGYAYGGIQSRGSLGCDVFGGAFLKGVYAVFDIGNLRFGAVQGTAL